MAALLMELLACATHGAPDMESARVAVDEAAACRAAEDAQLNQDVVSNGGGSLRRGNGFALGGMREEHGMPTNSPQPPVLADSEAGSHTGEGSARVQLHAGPVQHQRSPS